MRWLLPCLVLLWAGCIDELEPAWLIEDNRVLGARVEVRDDPSRAWPAPGETVDVTWRVVDPDEPAPLTWAFAWCPAAPVSFGTPFCIDDAEPTLLPPQAEPDTAEPSFALEVPAAGDLEGATSILLLGLVCADGTIELDPARLMDPDALANACQGEGAKGTPVTLTLPLAIDGASNANPQLDALSFRGTPWPAPPQEVLQASRSGCPADASLPEVEAGGSAVSIGLRVPSTSLETFEAVDDGGRTETRVEELQVAHFTTGGELERLFTFIEDEADPAAEVSWEPPSEDGLVADRELVRFHFVVSDGRAGATFATRALCVTRSVSGG
ncbi:MAG: hypothetical protein ACOCV4_03270 [Myxococcota bacterium]